MESKIEFLINTGVWPLREQMNPRAWLNNFKDNERPFAFNLLNIFMYYNEHLIDALLQAAVQQLSAPLTSSTASLRDARLLWQRFLTSALITYVQGENPNPTDSGIVFARKARQVLAVDERRIIEPQRASAALAQNPNSPVILLDDFMGSGNQVIDTWHRAYTLSGGQPHSFAAAAQRGASIFFLPIIATEYGLARVQERCIGLTVRPAHILDARYSLTAPNCILWPAALRPHSQSFLFRVSRRAGIVDECDHGWQGFHNLGLALAFSHSVPDATLPLFFWNRNGWVPLIART